MSKTLYIGGLDVGLAQQSTALAVLERTEARDPRAPGRPSRHYAVRHLERFPLGTPLPDVAAPPLREGMLAVDVTAVGLPVIGLLSRHRVAARLRPVVVTGGHHAQMDDAGGWLVPKKALISSLQVLLQSRRLKVAPSLPDAQVLVQELESFRMKVTVSQSEAEEWRERPHDDLVLAVAVAAWEEENLREFRVA
jgi:hypothetical protein